MLWVWCSSMPPWRNSYFTIFQGATVPIGSLTAEQLRTTLPAGPVTIPSRAPQTGAPFDRLPSELFELRIRLDRRLIASFPPSVSAEIVRESSEGRRGGLARLLASRDQPDNPLRKVPLIVLTRGQDMTPGIADNHAGLARLSSNARHVVVKASGHEIHLYDPVVVIDAIQDVATSATRGDKLRQ